MSGKVEPEPWMKAAADELLVLFERTSAVGGDALPREDYMAKVIARHALAPAPAGGVAEEMHPCDSRRFMPTAAEAEHRALDAMAAAQRERDAAVALLREVEWGGTACHDYGSSPACPSCNMNTSGGERIHRPDCRLSAFLKAHGGAQQTTQPGEEK